MHTNTDYLNTPICNATLRVAVTMELIGRYQIHLFVATRCRLSSHKMKLSIWMKIGFIMLISDFLLVLSVWLYEPQIVPIYNGSTCIVSVYSLLFICWVLANDIIISIYCMVVFVLPLKKIIMADREVKSEEAQYNTKAGVTKPEKSMESLVKRIMFCAIIASLGPVVACSIASFGPTMAAGPFMVELESMVACYFTLMQFKDIDPNDVESKFWKFLITMFQWDFWPCCPWYTYRNDTVNNMTGGIKMGKHGSNKPMIKMQTKSPSSDDMNEIAVSPASSPSSKTMEDEP